MGSKLKLILHIGRHKTGTSSLQYFLKENSNVLNSKGILYPSTGLKGVAHHGLIEVLRRGNDAELGKIVSDIVNEAKLKKCTNLIISSEGFQNCQPYLVKKMFSCFEVYVVCYFRNIHDYISSAYAQKVHATLYGKNIEEFVSNFNCDYQAFCNKWKAHFENFSVHDFTRSQLVEGDIRKDFILNVYDIFLGRAELSKDYNFINEDGNPSLNEEQTDFKLEINRNAYLSRFAKYFKGEIYRAVPRLKTTNNKSYYLPVNIAESIEEKYKSVVDEFCKEYDIKSNFTSIKKIDISEIVLSSSFEDLFVKLIVEILKENRRKFKHIRALGLIFDYFFTSSVHVAEVIELSRFSSEEIQILLNGSIKRRAYRNVSLLIEEVERNSLSINEDLYRYANALVIKNTSKPVKVNRIAISISGMVRGNFKAIESINKFIGKLEGKGVEVDVFLDIWDIKQNYSPGGQPSMARRLPPDVVRYLPEKYLNIKSFEKKFPYIFEIFDKSDYGALDESAFEAIKNLKNINIESQEDFHNSFDLKCKPDLYFNGNLNQINMFYKIYTSISTIKDYSKKNDLTYDVIIRTRPDTVLASFDVDGFLLGVEERTIYTRNITKNGCGDVFFYGHHKCMQVISEIWKDIIARGDTNIFGDGRKMFAEPLLGNYVYKNGYTYKVSNSIRATLPLNYSKYDVMLPANYDASILNEYYIEAGKPKWMEKLIGMLI